jgi:hypothetical protein
VGSCARHDMIGDASKENTYFPAPTLRTDRWKPTTRFLELVRPSLGAFRVTGRCLPRLTNLAERGRHDLQDFHGGLFPQDVLLGTWEWDSGLETTRLISRPTKTRLPAILCTASKTVRGIPPVNKVLSITIEVKEQVSISKHERTITEDNMVIRNHEKKKIRNGSGEGESDREAEYLSCTTKMIHTPARRRTLPTRMWSRGWMARWPYGRAEEPTRRLCFRRLGAEDACQGGRTADSGTIITRSSNLISQN